MPRSVRIQYAGAVYHVLCRRDRREAIFTDDADREIFLTTLAQMCQRKGMLVHVLMSNPYHLLLETPQPNLSAGMKWFFLQGRVVAAVIGVQGAQTVEGQQARRDFIAR